MGGAVIPHQPDELRKVMRTHDGKVDACIVGSGAAGAVLAAELAEAGMSVVVLEAGDWLDTRRDYVNDELSMLGAIDWDDPRISDGEDPLTLGRVNTGRAVGGTTVHYTAMALRMDPSDFEVATRDGVGVDWPFGYDELAPYYAEVERRLPVSGPRRSAWPSGAPYPHGSLPWSAKDEIIGRGLDRAGYHVEMTPHAIATGPVEGRSACMYYGFCVDGCKSDAKGSVNVNYLPRAVVAGAEIRPGSFAVRVETEGGRATGVTYLSEGEERFQSAERVFVCCYAIETPRLLLNSGNLANSSDQVGRNLMVHSGPIVYGRFGRPLDSFVTPPVGVFTRDPYPTDPDRGFARGYLFNTYAQFPINFGHSIVRNNPDLWGQDLIEVLDEYANWGLLASLGEVLPNPENRVTLDEETDDHGVPIAHVTFSYGENDRALIEAMKADGTRVMEAAGATRILLNEGNHHVLGTCRMGTDPSSSVVDPDCRSHDVANLWICDGSVLPTVGAVNPSLTIQALATRTARRLVAA
ncbi:MAG: GMC family oxidoreductase [Actinobacteria bacterium]|nr:GMC family oxidoreductase [Actinomycetota bacterium]